MLFRSSSGGSNPPVSAILDGLTPATRYAYRVGHAREWSEWNQFATATAAPAPFQFVWFGDPQDDVLAHCARTFREAVRVAGGARLWLFTGDLCSDPEDARWGELFQAAGFAFRRRFKGATAIFYMAIASLIVPGLVLSIGILVTFRYLGLSASWYTSALGAHLSWALPFGLLIMFAILGRLSPSYEEAAYDLGASKWQTVKDVVVPIVFPGMIAVALFGFTLSYDEFPRSWLTVGTKNTLPLEIWTMTTNVTSPALYALGTVTTVVSFIVIAIALGSIVIIQRKRSRGK